jgi:hypothetical protein
MSFRKKSSKTWHNLFFVKINALFFMGKSCPIIWDVSSPNLVTLAGTKVLTMTVGTNKQDTEGVI